MVVSNDHWWMSDLFLSRNVLILKCWQMLLWMCFQFIQKFVCKASTETYDCCSLKIPFQIPNVMVVVSSKSLKNMECYRLNFMLIIIYFAYVFIQYEMTQLLGQVVKFSGGQRVRQPCRDFAWYMYVSIYMITFSSPNFHPWYRMDFILTHCGLVMPCGVIDLGQHWYR